MSQAPHGPLSTSERIASMKSATPRAALTGRRMGVFLAVGFVGVVLGAAMLVHRPAVAKSWAD